MEEALRLVLRLDAVSVVCAGRTDAGVHARGQVVHVDVPAEAYAGVAEVLAHRLAGVLPADVGVRALAVAPEGFDARFSPLWRRYAYRVSDAPYGVDPLRRHDVLTHRRPLDVDRLNEASTALLGEHDFAAYCRRRRGRHDGADAARAALGARAGRPGRRDAAGRRVLPQHGALPGRCAARGRRRPAPGGLAGARARRPARVRPTCTSPPRTG